MRVGRCAGQHRVNIVNGEAAKHPPLIVGKIRSCMQAAAIVPHHQIADLPDMFLDELGASQMGEQKGQNFVAFVLRQTDNFFGHQLIDEQR